MIKKEIYLIILISILTIQLAQPQPAIRYLYPYIQRTITISYTPSGVRESVYISEARLSQPLNPMEELCRIEIIDSTHDSIYFKPLAIVYYKDTTASYPYRFCGFYDTTEPCPFNIIISNHGFPAPLTNNIRLIDSFYMQTYSLYECTTYVTPTGDTLPCYTSSNIHLIRIAPHIWNLFFGIFYIDTIVPPKEPFDEIYVISSVCNDSHECTGWLWLYNLLPPFPTFWPSPPSFKFDFIPKNGTTFTNSLPSQISLDITLNGHFHDRFYFFRLDSTSAWFIIRFETITGDTFTDTVRYGDPGTFWIVPPGKHIGWRRFGVMTMHTDIPSRGYTGVVEVCLMDVTNAPVIAFG